MNDTEGISQDKLKLSFSRPKGEISRRELFKLALPHYEIVPFIEPATCRGKRECGICLETCPLGAITPTADKVTIDTALCSGCGACVIACPHRAIAYPTFSLENLDKEMKGLLDYVATLPGPGIIAFTCQNCLAADRFTYPDNVLPLKIPCIAIVSPWLMLRALERGARGLALIFNSKRCPVGNKTSGWQENISFVRGLLSSWKIEPERIAAFEVAGDDYRNVEQELERFAREIASLNPIPLAASEPSSVPDDGLLLPALIKDLGDKLGSPSGRVATTGKVPFARMVVDSSQCTCCGLCTLNCPTRALTTSSSEETDNYQLLFRHDCCIACGRCVTICPENCIQMERVLELDKLNDPAVVLFEDRIAHCRECGSVIGSRLMIDRLQAKLQPIGEAVASQVELCSNCKGKLFKLRATNRNENNEPD